VGGLKHQEKRSMDHFAGLDVSVKETSLCIVDGTGKIVREVKVASEPRHFAGSPDELCLPL
jgi:transposase